MPNGAKWFDNTLKAEGISEEDVIKFFEEQTDIDRWCFEKETGEETGYEHYQVRYVLKQKSDLISEVIRWREHFGADHNHLSVLGMKHPNWDYVQKEGNYVASWEYKSPINKFKNITLLPWQGQAIAELGDQNDREITVIVDEKGNHGKSWLGKYIEANKIGDYVPMMEDHKDWIQYAMAFPSKCYVIDVPRADTIKQKKAMWTAIEQIKNGCLYDGRYSCRKQWIDPPKMLIFANEMPPIETLSHDRWRIYQFERWGTLDTIVRIDYKSASSLRTDLMENRKGLSRWRVTLLTPCFLINCLTCGLGGLAAAALLTQSGCS